MEALLAPFDYDVIMAGNGQEAVDSVRQTPPDVILMDVMMPVMDGLEATKRLKEDDRTKAIPIIMITALDSVEDRVKALEAGADDFLTKPVDRTELTARVRNSLKVKEYFDMIDLQNRQLLEAYEIIKREQEKSDILLRNVLPEKIAFELKHTGQSRPESFQNVTVLFSDIVGFTGMSSNLAPEVLIGELNEIFTAFDKIIEENGCERIKTIGDAYLAVCGMPVADEKHAENIVKSAVEIIDYLEDRNSRSGRKWEVRIGVHSGKVVGGIVGIKKYIYDVFGDTINVASRMENCSEPMEINISETTYDLVQNSFAFIERAPMEVKGKGEIRMFFIDN